MTSEPIRVRLLLPDGWSPLVWTVVGRRRSPLGEVVELAAAGRRLVVPLLWVVATHLPAAPLRLV